MINAISEAIDLAVEATTTGSVSVVEHDLTNINSEKKTKHDLPIKTYVFTYQQVISHLKPQQITHHPCDQKKSFPHLVHNA